MPIDPFLALNAMIRAEVTRSADPVAGPAAARVRTRESRAQEGRPARSAPAQDSGRTDARTDDAS